MYFDAGWSSPVACQAHNLKVAGSNPAPATKFNEDAAAPKAAAFLFVPAKRKPRGEGDSNNLSYDRPDLIDDRRNSD